jgi:hypothetical protein
MGDESPAHAPRAPWVRIAVLIPLWVLVLIWTYEGTVILWNGDARIIQLYGHGPSPQMMFIVVVFLTSVVFCVIDVCAIGAALAKKRPPRRWRLATGPLLAVALGLSAIPDDYLLAGTIYAWGPNKNARIELHNSAAGGRRRTVEALLEQGVSPVVLDGGVTFLHVAAQEGQLEIVDAAIAHGIDVNAKDARGRTPLDYAATANRRDVVEHLLSKGAREGSPAAK